MAKRNNEKKEKEKSKKTKKVKVKKELYIQTVGNGKGNIVSLENDEGNRVFVVMHKPKLHFGYYVSTLNFQRYYKPYKPKKKKKGKKKDGK